MNDNFMNKLIIISAHKKRWSHKPMSNMILTLKIKNVTNNNKNSSMISMSTLISLIL